MKTVRLATTTPIRHFELPPGIHPVKMPGECRIVVKDYLPELTEISRQIWTYLGYAGLLQPWHDNPDRFMWFKIHEEKLKLFFWTMDDMGVDWRTYCVLSFVMSDYSQWERVLLLLNNRKHWSWIRKLRQYAGSSERLDELADFVLKLMGLQIETYGYSRIKTSSAVKLEAVAPRKGKKPSQYFAVYHQLSDRLGQLKAENIDYSIWLTEKFRRCQKMEYVYLSTIVNMNGFDPDLRDLRNVANDPWRAIREFLGLSRDCQFPDGCIPKGWVPGIDAVQDNSRIVRVLKDGYYFYENGEQRRGKYHYARNKYLLIQCTPENFDIFKPTWHDVRYLTASPTWEEYSAYAVYPGLWDERGKSTNERGANIRWGK